jgi:methylglutamate dehydrogenase subunit C
VGSVLNELAGMPNVRLMERTTVTGVYDQGTYGALERVGLHRAPGGDAPLECFWRIVARQAVLAGGAHERHIAFRDNDRPGVMSAGAVRAYLNRWGVSPGKSVAIFCNNDDAHRTARDLQAAGVRVAALIDVREDAQIPRDIPGYTGAVVTGTKGRLGLEEVIIRHGAGEKAIRADCLAVSGGWNPAVHLTCHMNGRPVWREDIAAFVPAPGAIPGLHPAGAANGVFSTAGCLADGVRAAGAALEALGREGPAGRPAPKAEDGAYALKPFWQVPGKGRAWLDFQNDVTVKDIGLAAQENFRRRAHEALHDARHGDRPGQDLERGGARHPRRHHGRTIPETGTTTFRPPYVPVSIAAMGAGSYGQGLRAAALHHLAPGLRRARRADDRGRALVPPSYFPKPGETTWRQSCDREVAMVRSAVGVCDVSTLGKIDIQGPGAAEFLDFVYTNTFSTLPVGRVRYGLMLREDGFVMDDGTTARLGSTTTS